MLRLSSSVFAFISMAISAPYAFAEDVAFDAIDASNTRLTFTDTLDVAVSVTLARAILCAATDVDDVAVDETTMSA
jgi:hypothetical protein